MCLIGKKVPQERAKTSEAYRLCARSGCVPAETLRLSAWVGHESLCEQQTLFCLQSRTWEFVVSMQTLQSTRQPYQEKAKRGNEQA